MKKTKVLLIQNVITHYNFPIYILLSQQPNIELTLAHFGNKKYDGNNSLKEILLTSRKIGPFLINTENIFSICNSYDVVIALGDIHYLSLMNLGRRRQRKFKLIFWGIGVSASYKNQFDKAKRWDSIRYYFMRRADALLFYSEYPVEKYSNNDFDRERLFVAPNTVEVKRTIFEEQPKNSILFIGTLYKEKGIYELLSAYENALIINKTLPFLYIIGDGEEYQNLSDLIKIKALEKFVFLKGAIYNDSVLENFFINALATISPGQAGLSVLKSMGFGVPYITRNDSITGGERFNIVNNETGLIYENESELVNILCEINNNKEKFLLMGKNSLSFYEKFRKPENMVEGFIEAINYLTRVKV